MSRLSYRIDVVCVRHPDARNEFSVFSDGVMVEQGLEFVSGGAISSVNVHDLDLGASFDASKLSAADSPALRECVSDWREADVPQAVRDRCVSVYEALLEEAALHRY